MGWRQGSGVSAVLQLGRGVPAAWGATKKSRAMGASSGAPRCGTLGACRVARTGALSSRDCLRHEKKQWLWDDVGERTFQYLLPFQPDWLLL